MTTGPTNRSVRTEQLPPDDPTLHEACRRCGAALTADARFCESCGYDHADNAIWSVEITASRTQHEQGGSGLPFPTGRVAVVLVFELDEITIGRRNESRNVHPDVDLSGELADPGVSHAHATITRDATSGVFTIVDLGSTNGTTINDDAHPIEPHRPMRLNAGDRIHIGAWTAIEIRS